MAYAENILKGDEADPLAHAARQPVARVRAVGAVARALLEDLVRGRGGGRVRGRGWGLGLGVRGSG